MQIAYRASGARSGSLKELAFCTFWTVSMSCSGVVVSVMLCAMRDAQSTRREDSRADERNEDVEVFSRCLCLCLCSSSREGFDLCLCLWVSSSSSR